MPASTSADRGADVRRRLLAAAAQLIPEVGWHAVSTRGVAQRAGVAPGLVHYHFESLQSLLRQAVIGAMREVLSALPPVLPADEPPETTLAGILSSLDDYSGTDPASLLFVEAYLAATRDTELRTDLSGLLDEFRGLLASWLADQRTPEPTDTAAVLAAAVDGVMLHRALHPTMTSTVVTPVLLRMLGASGELGAPDENADAEGTEPR